mgnify:CR=1 FL=1
MYIETDRMVIRDFTMDDLNDLHDIFGDNETMKNCESAYTIEKTTDFLKKFCIEKRGAVAAVRKENDKMIVKINELAKEGKAIIVISSEMQEIMGTCDRVYVINEGEIAGELSKEEVSQERIMQCIMAHNRKGE